MVGVCEVAMPPTILAIVILFSLQLGWRPMRCGVPACNSRSLSHATLTILDRAQFALFDAPEGRRTQMSDWFSRPVFFVADVDRAATFYVDKLGFVEDQRYEEGGVALVANVARSDCAILLNSQQSERIGTGRMFISLDRPTFDALKAEFEQRGAPVEQGWWGYELMVVRDPDGNELFFPEPGEAG
jgi:catechol 2,3-dioxygenase-like lactoylglutathione lyase family enzyme